MAKQLKEFLESFEFNRAALAKQRLANLRHSGRRVRGARIANLMRAAGLKEEEMDETDLDQLDEVLNADATASDWIHDFVHSTNPKFEGKSKKERIKMALGAYYSKARAKQQNEEVELEEGSDHEPWHVARNNKKSADSAREQGDTKAYHMHMADHHENMAQWSMNRGRSSVAKQHQMKADQHNDWAHGVKEEVEKKKKEDLPFEPDAPKKNPPATAGKYGQGYSTARHLARQGMKQAMKEEYGVDISDEIADEILEAAKQYTGPVKVQVQADKEAHEEKWESAKKKPVKEQYDEEGNLIPMAKTYQEFMEAMTATVVRPGVTRYTGGSYGNAKGAKYGNTDYDKETLDTKDDEGTETQKRGRGRPAGSKSGARGPRIK